MTLSQPTVLRIARVEVTTAAATGATHQARGTGSDDAAIALGPSGEAVLATVAIADGHSDPRCVRSHTGAQFAVAAVAAVPVEAHTPGAITAAVVREWRRLVDADLAARPLTEAGAASRDLPRLAYGTTLAWCRVTPSALTIGWIGDGDVIAVAPDATVQRLTSDDPVDLTESLSDDAAEFAARSVHLTAAEAPVLLLLATDGIDNAYPHSESMLQAASQLAELRRTSGRRLPEEVLQQWTREAAEVSGDDATVAVLWLETAAATHPAATQPAATHPATTDEG